MHRFIRQPVVSTKDGLSYWQSGEGTPELLLIATGSMRWNYALNAAAKLAEESVNVRVVSMPSFELFEQQDAAYQESVLPDACDRRGQSRRERALGWE